MGVSSSTINYLKSNSYNDIERFNSSKDTPLKDNKFYVGDVYELRDFSTFVYKTTFEDTSYGDEVHGSTTVGAYVGNKFSQTVDFDISASFEAKILGTSFDLTIGVGYTIQYEEYMFKHNSFTLTETFYREKGSYLISKDLFNVIDKDDSTLQLYPDSDNLNNRIDIKVDIDLFEQQQEQKTTLVLSIDDLFDLIQTNYDVDRYVIYYNNFDDLKEDFETITTKLVQDSNDKTPKPFLYVKQNVQTVDNTDSLINNFITRNKIVG